MNHIFIFKDQTVPAVNSFPEPNFRGRNVVDVAEQYLNEHLTMCDPRHVSGTYTVICLVGDDPARQFTFEVEPPVAFEINRV